MVGFGLVWGVFDVRNPVLTSLSPRTSTIARLRRVARNSATT